MTDGVWIASYVLLWVLVLVLVVAVIALLRQIGVLHARLSPLGTHPGGEGPELDSLAPVRVELDYDDAALTLVAFTSPTCTVCATLRPSLEAVRRTYGDLHLHVVDLADGTRSLFDAFNVRSTPYVVAVDGDGIVRGAGVANSLEQVEELVEDARRRSEPASDPEATSAVSL